MVNIKPVIVLIDGRNLGGEFKTWRSYRLEKLVYIVLDRFQKCLVGKGYDIKFELKRVYYYYSIITEIPDRVPKDTREKWVIEKDKDNKFMDAISDLVLFEVRKGYRVPRFDNDLNRWYLKEKGVDMYIGVDIVRFSRRYPYILLISGDSDLSYAIEKSKEEGLPELTVAVFIPGNQLSTNLRDSSDISFNITDEDIKKAGGNKLRKINY
jgi:uncharacterized LabA/DUF88 family protein